MGTSTEELLAVINKVIDVAAAVLQFMPTDIVDETLGLTAAFIADQVELPIPPPAPAPVLVPAAGEKIVQVKIQKQQVSMDLSVPLQGCSEATIARRVATSLGSLTALGNDAAPD